MDWHIYSKSFTSSISHFIGWNCRWCSTTTKYCNQEALLVWSDSTSTFQLPTTTLTAAVYWLLNRLGLVGRGCQSEWSFSSVNMIISLSVGTSLKLCNTIRPVLTSPCFVSWWVKGNAITQVTVPISTLSSDCFPPLDNWGQSSGKIENCLDSW